MYMQETDRQDLYTALIYFQSKLKNDISECCLYVETIIAELYPLNVNLGEQEAHTGN